MSHKSITQMIYHSDVFKKWLETNVAEMENDDEFAPRVRNLRAAKHRLESHAKP